jgi:hypothetical protein
LPSNNFLSSFLTSNIESDSGNSQLCGVEGIVITAVEALEKESKRNE